MNADQRAAYEALARIPPAERCWCGWFRLGECLNGCPEGKTAADKLAVACPECHNAPMNHGAGPMVHNVVCSRRGP